MEILYLNYPLQKAAFSSNGGVWFNNDELDKLEHKEIIEDCTMGFTLWLKYYSQIKL